MDADIVVIGAGPGGYAAAIRGAQLGKKVTLVEKDALGGICLNWGCIPTKALIKSAEVLSLLRHSEQYGVTVQDISINFERVIGRSRKIATTLSRGIAYLMKKNNITVVTGHGTFKDPQTIEVSDGGGTKRTISANHFLIATGGRPRGILNINPETDTDAQHIMTSKEAMIVPQQPRSIAIIGGGAIGVEFAYFFNAIGTEVMLFEMRPHILPLEDTEISTALVKSFQRKGIKVRTNAQITAIQKQNGGVTVSYNHSPNGSSANGSTLSPETVSADAILLATGIRGNSDALNLEAIGISPVKTFIPVNTFYQTKIPSIYAIGDVIGPPLLAHAATHEGIVAIEHMLGHSPQPIDYTNIPSCTYCNPQVASIGLTETQAQEAGYQIKVGRFPLKANGKALAINKGDGFVKIIFDAAYDECLGCHIIGPDATEMITEITMAKTLESTYKEIRHTIHPHPTISEAIMEAAGNAYNEAIHI